MIKYTMNTTAMKIPSDKLLDALKEHSEKKQEYLEKIEKTYSGKRVRISSYLENIVLPELFGFDMNELYSNPELAIEMELRQKIFWLDNSLDDSDGGKTDIVNINGSVGMYFDITLFGQKVSHDRSGVPYFQTHPVSQKPDLSLIPPVDFYSSGEMPPLIKMYNGIQKISGLKYNNRISVDFPSFIRGPLDVYIQLRGYENFVADTMERPGFTCAFLEFIADQRANWNRERCHFLNQSYQPESTFIADDWINVPFISPGIFRKFVIPAYKRIEKQEGILKGFHTCGVITPIVQELLSNFPHIKSLDVSGWNDFEKLDQVIDPGVHFHLNFINTFVLTGTHEEHREKLKQIARIRKRRGVSICVQAIVRVHDDFAEDLNRMNRFIELARDLTS